MERRRDGPLQKAHVSECDYIVRAIGDIDAKDGPNTPVHFVQHSCDVYMFIVYARDLYGSEYDFKMTARPQLGRPSV